MLILSLEANLVMMSTLFCDLEFWFESFIPLSCFILFLVQSFSLSDSKLCEREQTNAVCYLIHIQGTKEKKAYGQF